VLVLELVLELLLELVELLELVVVVEAPVSPKLVVVVEAPVSPMLEFVVEVEIASKIQSGTLVVRFGVVVVLNALNMAEMFNEKFGSAVLELAICVVVVRDVRDVCGDVVVAVVVGCEVDIVVTVITVDVVVAGCEVVVVVCGCVVVGRTVVLEVKACVLVVLNVVVGAVVVVRMVSACVVVAIDVEIDAVVVAAIFLMVVLEPEYDSSSRSSGCAAVVLAGSVRAVVELRVKNRKMLLSSGTSS